MCLFHSVSLVTLLFLVQDLRLWLQIPTIIYINMKLIKYLIKNHHDYVQDSQGITRSEILLISGQKDEMTQLR
jgi:hypothetical protein